MRVVCIDKRENRNGWVYTNLTIGKIYDVISIDKFDDGRIAYFMNGDNGYACDYLAEVFKPLDEYRNEKINEILL